MESSGNFRTPIIVFSAITSVFTMILFIMQAETNIVIDQLQSELNTYKQTIDVMNANIAALQRTAANSTGSQIEANLEDIVILPYPDTCNNVMGGQTCPMPSWTSDTIDTAYASLVVKGNAWVEGSLYINSGTVNVLTPFGRVSISDLVSVLIRVNTNDDCGIEQCVNGILNGFNCSCVCFEGYEGTYCDTAVCTNGVIDTDGLCDCPVGYTYSKTLGCTIPLCVYGVYSTIQQTCICNDGYTGDKCETPIDEQCSFCECPTEMYGNECEYNCTANAVMENDCFVNIYNYGQDTCETLNDNWVCMCGGGYTYDKNIIITTIVYGYQGINAPMYLLCSPYMYTSSFYQCQSQSCCSSISADSCTIYGCSFNESSCVYTPSQNAVGSIYWSHIVTDCTNYSTLLDWEITKCSSILSRYLYLNTYDTASTLQDARGAINTLSWNELATTLVRLSGIQFLFSGIVAHTGEIQNTPYIAVNSNNDGLPSVVFTLQVYVRSSLFETGGYSITFVQDGVTYCIASFTTYVQQMLSYYGSGVSNLVGINLSTYYTGTRSAYYDICAKFSSSEIVNYYFRDIDTSKYLYTYNINSNTFFGWTDTPTTINVITVN